MRRFLIHVYHSGENVSFADFLFHEVTGFGEKGSYLFSVPTLEELRTGGNERVNKHCTVFSSTTSCRLDAGINLLSIFDRWTYDVKIIFTAGNVNIGIAGIFFFGALVMSFQRPACPALCFANRNIACCAIKLLSPPILSILADRTGGFEFVDI